MDQSDLPLKVFLAALLQDVSRASEANAIKVSPAAMQLHQFKPQAKQTVSHRRPSFAKSLYVCVCVRESECTPMMQSFGSGCMRTTDIRKKKKTDVLVSLLPQLLGNKRLRWMCSQAEGCRLLVRGASLL